MFNPQATQHHTHSLKLSMHGCHVMGGKLKDTKRQAENHCDVTAAKEMCFSERSSNKCVWNVPVRGAV